MAYIDTKYLGQCETCRHYTDSGCNTFCDCGESYSPNMFKIPTADVVEVVRCKNCVYWDNASNWTPECRRLDGLSSPNEDDFCSYGTPKERGGEK